MNEMISGITTALTLGLTCFTFMTLSESRFPNRVYYISSAIVVLVSSGISAALLYEGGMALMSKWQPLTASFFTLAFFYFMAKHRDGRFLFTFCSVDLFVIAIGMFASIIGMPLGNNTLTSGLAVVLVAVFAVIVIKYVRKPYLKIMKDFETGWGVVAAVSIVFYLFMLLVFYMPTAIQERPKEIPMAIVTIVLLFAVYIVIYQGMVRLDGIREREKAELQMKKKIYMMENQYKITMSNFEAIRTARHDLQHHLRVISGLFEEHKEEELKKYLDCLVENAREKESMQFCKNHVGNIILSWFSSQSKDNQVEMVCHTNLPLSREEADTDFSIIFSNLLQNALDAAMGAKVESPHIFVKSYPKGTSLILKIENDFNGKIRQEKGKILTLKEGKKHGIGLDSVNAAVGRLGGYIRLHYTTTVFTAEVVLPNILEEK